MERWTRGMLLVGAGMSVSMAAYHFVLPVHFRWADHVEAMPPVIRWALFAINFFFSLLLAVSGGTVFAVAWSRSHAHGPGLWVVAGGATFWAVNLGYQAIELMPLPASLFAVRVGLLAFAGLAFLLHALPVGVHIWIPSTKPTELMPPTRPHPSIM